MSDSPSRRPRVVMAGPARSVRGGVSAVVNSLLDALPEDAPSIVYVPTHVDGPAFLKACAAVCGALAVACAVAFGRRRIVHLHMASNASFRRKSLIARTARLLGASVIIHVHGAGFDVFFREAPARLKSSITRTLESARLVIALSDEWRVRLSRIAPDADIRVLPNPVVVDDFAPAVEGREDVPPGGGRLLFLGAFGKRKGVYDLLEAMPAIVARRSGVILEMGGDQEVDEVTRRVRESGLSDNVRMLGWVRGMDKLAAFARAHIYVLPSYHEGLPIGVLEALAAGLPVVTTPVGGIPEVVRDGVNGLIISPGDVQALANSVLRLLDDGELRSRMSAANVALARRRHDAPRVASTLCDWYNELYGASR